jgi:hypothetical protein
VSYYLIYSILEIVYIQNIKARNPIEVRWGVLHVETTRLIDMCIRPKDFTISERIGLL